MVTLSFPEELYKQKPITDLIVFSIYSITIKEKKCTFERLVKECFVLFPKGFCFSENPEWPDSRKLDRPLRTLRNRKVITGGPKTSFSLTKQGKKAAEEVVRTFQQKKLKF